VSYAAAPRILAVRFSAIGDIILTTPLLRALKRRHPSAYLAVLTKAAFAPLLRDNPHVDRVIAWSPQTSLGALAAEIRAGRFDHHLDLHGSLRSRLLRLLVPGAWRGYPKHRVARTALIRFKKNRYPPGTPPVPERYFAAAADLDVTPDGAPAEVFVHPDTDEGARGWLAAAGLGGDRPLVAVAPMAAHATKRWPAESWAEAVRRLTERDADVVVLGGPGDEATCNAIARSGGRARSAAGAFDLQGTAALIRRAAVVAAGDTGVMHMSTGLGRPVVALFGPTVEPFGFFPYRAEAVVLQQDLPCRPCSKMGGPRCPLGHHRCLRDIGVDEVLAAIREYL